MLYFIGVTLHLTDVTLDVMHSALKHDSIHMCKILCEPLSSQCSADKSLTRFFYSWRPSQNGYHLRNSPCANMSCSVSPVPRVPGRPQQRSFSHPLHHTFSLFLQSKMFWAHLQVRVGLVLFLIIILTGKKKLVDRVRPPTQEDEFRPGYLQWGETL